MFRWLKMSDYCSYGEKRVNMTDEEITLVEALRICHSNEDCRDCKFVDSDKDEMSCVNVLFVKAADLIESLCAELERVMRERDAAVEDMKDKQYGCEKCKHFLRMPGKTCDLPYEERKPSFECWQWRGVRG